MFLPVVVLHYQLLNIYVQHISAPLTVAKHYASGLVVIAVSDLATTVKSGLATRAIVLFQFGQGERGREREKEEEERGDRTSPEGDTMSDPAI